jgi:hypothetical protein
MCTVHITTVQHGMHANSVWSPQKAVMCRYAASSVLLTGFQDA